MKINKYPTQKRIKELLRYEDGKLYWRKRPKVMFKPTAYQGRVCNMWNLKHAGNQAGADNGTGYLTCRVDNQTVLISRLVYIYFNGNIDSLEIDHINQDKQDNRIENLRVATRAQNINNTGLRKNNKSGVRGVYFKKRDQKWIATITKHYNKKEIGYFKTLQEAVVARKDAEKQFCMEA